MNEPETDRLRELLDDLASEVRPDLDERAATAIAAARRTAWTGRVLVPLAAAAAAILVVGVSYVVVVGLHRGSPPAGPSQSNSTTGGPAQTSSTTGTSTPTRTTLKPYQVNNFVVVGREKVDVDGDGQPDKVTLLETSAVAHSGEAEQRLKVVYATGNKSTDTWSAVAGTTMLPPVDLDGDGDMEIIVTFSAGEYYEMRVYDADNGHLAQVTAEDADGTPLPLGGIGSSTAWATDFTTDGRLVDYQWTTADPGTPPFTVKVRTWTMTDQTLTESGSTLTGAVLIRSDTTQKGCFDLQNYRTVLTLGACQ